MQCGEVAVCNTHRDRPVFKIHKERCGKDVTRLALSIQAEVDMLRFHDVDGEAEGINVGEALRTAATGPTDMGLEDLLLLLVRKPDEKLDLLIFDPMPGGSGLLEQMLSRWQELIASAKELLAGCTQGCETACYASLKTFRNQFYHNLLNRHQAMELAEKLNHQPEAFRDIVPVFEEETPGGGGPSSTPRLGSTGYWRITFPGWAVASSYHTSVGLTPSPDWFHEQSKVAVYLDGMSKALHGDPTTNQMDQYIRGMLEVLGYKVIVVQSQDLDDPQAVRQHLKSIAQALGRSDLAEAIQSGAATPSAGPPRSGLCRQYSSRSAARRASETGRRGSELLQRELPPPHPDLHRP